MKESAIDSLLETIAQQPEIDCFELRFIIHAVCASFRLRLNKTAKKEWLKNMLEKLEELDK
jgi:hypothetical protein